MPSNPFSYSFSVPLHDIDAAGIMFYGHLFRHAHDAYEAFMRTIGLPLDRIVREADPLLPLVHAEADYRAPLRHGEVTRVELRVARVGRTSFTLDYRFIDGDGQMRASARTDHIGLDPDRTSSAPLPQALAATLSTWLCEDEGR